MLGGGCAFLQQLLAGAFKRPALRFRSANLADVSLGGATLNLVYALENPNPIDLSIAQVEYALSVEGHQVLAGKPPRGLKVRARGQSELVFPAAFKFAELVPVVQVFLNQESAAYRAEGAIGVQTPIGVLRLPLSYDGRFEVPKLPAVSIGAVRIANVSLAGARLELPLSVTSKNSFPLPIGGVGGSVRLAGVTVGSLSTGDLGALEPRATRQVTLPLEISFAAAPAVARAITSGSTSLALEGQVNSAGMSLPLSFNQSVSFRR